MLLKYFKLLALIAKLVYPKYNENWFLFYIIIKYQTIAKRLIKYNKLKTVSGEKLQSRYGDVNNTVLVSGKNLYINDNVLVLTDNKSTFRTVYVTPLSEREDSLVLYVSECLYHNFNNTSDILQLIDASTELQYAEEIHLSLISNNVLQELNNTDAVIDNLLKSYFSKPKIVYKNDIIEVNIKNDCPEVYYTNLKINLSQIHCVYFQCNKIVAKEPFSNLILVGNTTIKLDKNMQAFLPSKHIGHTGCPNGLEAYMTVIERAVLPFIQKSNTIQNLQPIFLLQGERGCGKEILIEGLTSQLGINLYKINCCLDLSANIYAQIETKIHNVCFNAKLAAPCIVLMDNFEVINATLGANTARRTTILNFLQNFGKNGEGHYDNRIISYFKAELTQLFHKNTFPIVIVCLMSEKNVLPPELKRIFLEIFEITAPTDCERVQMLEWILQQAKLRYDDDLVGIANRTHGFYYEDLLALVYYTRKNLTVSQDISEAFSTSIEFMQSNYNESLGAPKVPKVSWADVGGLPDVKNEIMKTINLPLKHPELLRKSGLRRTGILLFGPPGTGKTLIAKAVATQCALCFLSVKGPELLNMYVGQSEQNVREVFERARAASPCIIFFDELDSLAPNRGVSGDSGGVMDRVVSQLLAEIDGLNDEGTIFVIGATNRPDLIDPALLRPGRFDKLLYVGPCSDTESKLSVLRALTRKFNLENDIDLQQIIDICPDNITGADFYGICSNAWTSAAKRLIQSYNQDETEVIQSMTDKNVIVTLWDFELAIRHAKPSITKEDLQYFERLRLELSSNR